MNRVGDKTDRLLRQLGMKPTLARSAIAFELA